MPRAQVPASQRGPTHVVRERDLALHLVEVGEATLVELAGGGLEHPQERLRGRFARLAGDLVEALRDGGSGIAAQLLHQVHQCMEARIVDHVFRVERLDFRPDRRRPGTETGDVGQLGHARAQRPREGQLAGRLVVAGLGHGALPGGLRVQRRFEQDRAVLLGDSVLLQGRQRCLQVFPGAAQPRFILGVAPRRLEPAAHRGDLRSLFLPAHGALPPLAFEPLALGERGRVQITDGRDVLDRRERLLEQVECDDERVSQIDGVHAGRQRLRLGADRLELGPQGLPSRLALRCPIALQQHEALAEYATRLVLGAQVFERGGECGFVPHEFSMTRHQGVEVTGLTLEVERVEAVPRVGGRRTVGLRSGGAGRSDRRVAVVTRWDGRERVAPVDGDQRRGAGSAVATAQVGQRIVLVQDGRLDQLAQFARELLGALGLGLHQRPPRLCVAHRGDEGIEPADARRAERGNHLEHRLEVRERTGLEDQLALELLVHQLQLRLGFRDDARGVDAARELVFGHLDERPELADLGPAEVEVQRPQGRLELAQHDAHRVVRRVRIRRWRPRRRPGRAERAHGLGGGRARRVIRLGLGPGLDGAANVVLEFAYQFSCGRDLATRRLELTEHRPAQHGLHGVHRHGLGRGAAGRHALAQHE